MALMPFAQEPREAVQERFLIASDSMAGDRERTLQSNIRAAIAEVAVTINGAVEDSREKSLAITHLEEALMWAGKAIFR